MDDVSRWRWMSRALGAGPLIGALTGLRAGLAGFSQPDADPTMTRGEITVSFTMLGIVFGLVYGLLFGLLARFVLAGEFDPSGLVGLAIAVPAVGNIFVIGLEAPAGPIAYLVPIVLSGLGAWQYSRREAAEFARRVGTSPG